MRWRLDPYILALWSLLIAMHLLNLSFASIGSDAPDADLGAKPMHLVAALLAGFLFSHLKIVFGQLTNWLNTLGYVVNGLLVAIASAYLVSVGEIYFQKYSVATLKFIFAAYCLLLGYDISIRVTKRQFLSMLRAISWVTLIAILIKGIIYYPELTAPPTREGWKPEIPLFFSGGVNIESSMMVMASAFFAHRRSFYLFITAALVISVIYVSRTATLGCGVAMILIIFNPTQLSMTRITLAAIVCGIGLGWIFWGDNTFFLNRMTTIGSDSSSATRLEMLRGSMDAARRWPFGYGPGNAVSAVEFSHGDFRAGNVHNVFVQILLDFGIQGLVLWLAVIVSVARQMLTSKFQCPLGLFLMLYFIMSAVQFTGLESIAWLILGAFQGYSIKQETATGELNFGY